MMSNVPPTTRAINGSSSTDRDFSSARRSGPQLFGLLVAPGKGAENPVSPVLVLHDRDGMVLEWLQRPGPFSGFQVESFFAGRVSSGRGVFRPERPRFHPRDDVSDVRIRQLV